MILNINDALKPQRLTDFFFFLKEPDGKYFRFPIHRKPTS